MDSFFYNLNVCEMMIDRLQRELISNGSMLGAVNSAYEAMSDNEKQTYTTKRAQLNNLLRYRTDLLDAAANKMKETSVGGITLKVEESFSFAD